MIAIGHGSDAAGPSTAVERSFERDHAGFALGAAAGRQRFPRAFAAGPLFGEAAFEAAFRRDPPRRAAPLVRTIGFQGSSGCVLLDDGFQEVVVCTAGIPRILSYRRKEGTNQVDPGDPETNGTGHSRTGHTARILPEPHSTGFGLFQQASQWVATNLGARFFVHAEARTRFSYELAIRFQPAGQGLRLEHVLTSLGREHSPSSLRLDCPYGPGGALVVPRMDSSVGAASDAPTTALDLWPGTDLRQPCWSIGPRYLRLRHLRTPDPQRLALRVSQGWIAHVRGSSMFLRRFDGSKTGLYSESSSNVELVASPRGLESRILCAPRLLVQNQSLIVSEEWRIVPAPVEPLTEDLIDTLCLPVVGEGVPMR